VVEVRIGLSTGTLKASWCFVGVDGAWRRSAYSHKHIKVRSG
jgi:hypothetical protein